MSTGLSVQGLTLKRGAIEVCRGVSLDAPAGEITVVIGANGAGKSTLLDGIAGVLPASGGSLSLAGRSLDRMAVHRRATNGLSYVEQGRSVFGRLTVAQNLAVVDPSREAVDAAVKLFPRLADKLETRAGLLSGGEQQMLLIARGLAMNPTVLLVDELSLGLAPNIVQSIIRTLAALAHDGLGILMVEQYAELALRIGRTGYVMERGRVVRSGPCAELLADRAAIQSSYLSSADVPQPGRGDSNPT